MFSKHYLIVVSRGYDYESNRLKDAQKTVHPPVELKSKQKEKWLQEQAVLFERAVHHTPEPVNKSITLAKYIDHWLAEVAPKKLAKSTFARDRQAVRRILPALGHYKLTGLTKEVIRNFYEEMRAERKLTDGGHGRFESPFAAPRQAHNQTKKAAPKWVLPLVRPGGFEPLAFRVGEL